MVAVSLGRDTLLAHEVECRAAFHQAIWPSLRVWLAVTSKGLPSFGVTLSVTGCGREAHRELTRSFGEGGGMAQLRPDLEAEREEKPRRRAYLAGG